MQGWLKQGKVFCHSQIYASEKGAMSVEKYKSVDKISAQAVFCDLGQIK